MNKTYFAKYLPVEGEIKELDYYKHPDYPDKLFRFYEPWDDKKEKAYKVKLFLCSKDFNFPCDIYCFGEKVWRKDCQSTACAECVRVLGEISPNATWVKEGDEFDENEVQTWIKAHKPPFHSLDYTYYKIEGQCGHFH